MLQAGKKGRQENVADFSPSLHTKAETLKKMGAVLYFFAVISFLTQVIAGCTSGYLLTHNLQLYNVEAEHT